MTKTLKFVCSLVKNVQFFFIHKPQIQKKLSSYLLLTLLIIGPALKAFTQTVTPSEIQEWGNQCLNSSKSQTYTFTNNTTEKLEVNILCVSINYNGSSKSFSVNANTSVKFTMDFSFNSLGVFEENIYIYYKTENEGNFKSLTRQIKYTVIGKPSTPYNLTSSEITNKGCDLTWDCDYFPPSSRFSIKELNGNILKTVNSKSTTCNDWSPATVYNVKVCSSNDCYNVSGNCSGEISVLTKPNPPSNFTSLNLTSTDYTLNWTASSGIVSGYRIYDELGNLLKTTTATTYSITGLCPNTTRKYQIVAYNNSGESPKSQILTVTTKTPTITGADIVCPSGGLYSISDLPTGSSITWAPGQNITISSGQNTNSCLFITNGKFSNSSINASINVPGCGTYTRDKNVTTSYAPTQPVIGIPVVEPINCQVNTTAYAYDYPRDNVHTWAIQNPGTILSESNEEIVFIANCPPNNKTYPLTITVNASNFCGTSTVSRTVTIKRGTPGGHNPLSAIVPAEDDVKGNANLMIFPNPAYSQIEIKVNQDIFIERNLEINNTLIYIYNVSGTLVYQSEYKLENAQIDISDFKPGLYLIKLSNKDLSLTQSFVKK